MDYGLLKSGVEAVGDELGRGLNEDGAVAAQVICKAKEGCATPVITHNSRR